MGKIKVVLFDADTLNPREVEVTGVECFRDLLGYEPKILYACDEDMDLPLHGISVICCKKNNEKVSACVDYNWGFSDLVRGNLIFTSLKGGFLKNSKLVSLDEEQLDCIYRFMKKRKDMTTRNLTNLLCFENID